MIKTKAIILKSNHFNEIDKVLTIYTKELGKVRVSAKGTKKIESKLRYSIEPISYVGLILVEGKSFLILKDAVIIDQFLKIKKDLGKLKSARKIADFIDEAIVGEEKDENVWKLVLGTYKGLNVGSLASNIEEEFEKKLISLLGYDPAQVRSIEEIY